MKSKNNRDRGQSHKFPGQGERQMYIKHAKGHKSEGYYDYEWQWRQWRNDFKILRKNDFQHKNLYPANVSNKRLTTSGHIRIQKMYFL